MSIKLIEAKKSDQMSLFWRWWGYNVLTHVIHGIIIVIKIPLIIICLPFFIMFWVMERMIDGVDNILYPHINNFKERQQMIGKEFRKNLDG